MKKYRFFTLLVFAATLFSCGKQELPYDLEGTKHGVVINIAKKIGSSTTLSTNLNEGDYEVVLSFAPQQGDASMMKEAQVTAVYTDGQKNKKSCYAVKGITSLPATVKIDMKAVCQSLGITEVAVGDRIEFTPSYTLNDGTQVDGWITAGGGSFNNTIFTGWAMEDGSAYSFRVAYTAFAPFQKEKFQGTHSFYDGGALSDYKATVTQISELPDEAWIPKGVTADDLVGLKVEGDIWFGGDVFHMWINTQDYTIILPDQVLVKDWAHPDLGVHDAEMDRGEGEVDTLNNTLTFFFRSLWGPYSFGNGEIMIDFNS